MLMTSISPITNTPFLQANFAEIELKQAAEAAEKKPRLTCENCPAATKANCTQLCPDMERYLNCGNTTPHKSVGDFGMFDWLPGVIAHPSDDPEQQLVGGEVSEEVRTRLLRYVDGFATKVSKGDPRRKALTETMLVLVYLENYSYARAAEMLGETYAEFHGKELIERAGGGAPIEKQRGSRQTLRTCKQFDEYCAKLHLSEKIHEVLHTGSMDRIHCL